MQMKKSAYQVTYTYLHFAIENCMKYTLRKTVQTSVKNAALILIKLGWKVSVFLLNMENTAKRI